MDPEAVCLKNFGAEGETWDELKDWRVEMEWEFPDRNSLKECFAIAKKAIDWDNKYHAPGAKLLPNGRYHGIGVQWSHEWTCTKRPSQAALMIRTDGTVSIEGRRADIGCHIDTAICMIVADELGVKYEDVTHRIFNTSLGLEFQAPGGSTGMVANGPTVVRLARKAKAMLLDLATQGRPLGPSKTPREYTDPRPAVFPGKKPEELDCKDSVVFEKANPTNKKTVKEVVTAYWGNSRTDILQEPVVVDDFTGPIDWRFAHAQQIHMTEVEVDPETGLVEVTKVVCVNDVGIAMNPDTINGQQYGGAYMGVGRSNTEEMFYDPQTGVKMNDDLIFYPIALMNDIKQVESHIVETRQGYGAYGAVGIGENIGAIMSSCTNDAVYNAIGKWVDRIVTSPDKILRTLGKI
jgi:CO/xanthine dehydrogenase Mo-binding subunit